MIINDQRDKNFGKRSESYCTGSGIGTYLNRCNKNKIAYNKWLEHEDWNIGGVRFCGTSQFAFYV